MLVVRPLFLSGLHINAMQWTVNSVQCTALYSCTGQCNILLYIAWLYTVVKCNTLFYTAVQYTVLHCSVIILLSHVSGAIAGLQFSPLNYTTLHCTTLYYTAPYWTSVLFNVMYCTALHCIANIYRAPHWTALVCTVLYFTALVLTLTGTGKSHVPKLCSSSWENLHLIALWTVPCTANTRFATYWTAHSVVENEAYTAHQSFARLDC